MRPGFQEASRIGRPAGELRPNKRVQILAERLLIFPAVHARSPGIPIRDGAVRFRDNDRITGGLEKLGAISQGTGFRGTNHGGVTTDGVGLGAGVDPGLVGEGSGDGVLVSAGTRSDGVAAGKASGEGVVVSIAGASGDGVGVASTGVAVGVIAASGEGRG